MVSVGDLPIHITWSLKGKEVNSGDSITTTMLGQRVSMLVISSVDYSHVGEYTCRASNQAGSVTHSTELTVNGNRMVAGKALKVIDIINLILFISRTTSNHPLQLWEANHRRWRLCSTDMRCFAW